jgi:hypothetical protein
MRPATDSAVSFSPRALWSLAGLAVALNSFGCARLQEFRQQDRPVLGALNPGRDRARDAISKRKAEPSKPVDQYADALKGRRAADGGPLVAERDAAAKPTAPAESVAALDQDQEFDPGARRAAGTSRLPVTLAPPVALDEPPPVLAANAEQAAGDREPRHAGNDRAAEPDTTARRKEAKATTGPAPESPEAIVARARARLDKLESYQVHLNRQERVGAKLLPVEDVLLSVRRSPKAVRLEWPDGPHKGREVVYSASENGGLMQVNMADSPVPVPRLSLPPNSPLVMSNSRHPIAEAGFDTIVHNLEAAIALEKKGTPTDGKVTFGGREQPDGLDHPCDKLVRVTPSGETWLVYIDPNTQLPAMVQANAADGSLLERYLFLDPKGDVPELAQADAFDVAKRWGPPKGLLSRLVRPGANSAKQAEPESITR